MWQIKHQPQICHNNQPPLSRRRLFQSYSCGKLGTATTICHTESTFVWQIKHQPQICHHNQHPPRKFQLFQPSLCGKLGTATAICHTESTFVWQIKHQPQICHNNQHPPSRHQLFTRELPLIIKTLRTFSSPFLIHISTNAPVLQYAATDNPLDSSITSLSETMGSYKFIGSIPHSAKLYLQNVSAPRATNFSIYFITHVFGKSGHNGCVPIAFCTPVVIFFKQSIIFSKFKFRYVFIAFPCAP